MLTLLSGLAAGLVHVVTGPDHMAAVAPLAAGHRRQAWRIGFKWGIGHAAGVALVGVLAMALREALPLSSLGSMSERLVGVALIGLGLWSVRSALRMQIHRHEHAHDGQAHAHLHFHSPHHAHESAAGEPHSHAHAAFGFGTLHGLAGTSHLLGVLPSLALPSRFASLLYLAAFCAGTVLAMTAFSTVTGLVARRLERRTADGYRRLVACCGTVSIALGCWWVWMAPN